MDNRDLPRQGVEREQGLYDPQMEKDSCGVGFLCHIQGRKSNRLIQDSLKVLKRLKHRSATGSDPNTGDGAGILIQMPHQFFSEVCDEARLPLPDYGEYGTGPVSYTHLTLPTNREV